MKSKTLLVPLVTVGLAGAMLAAPLSADAASYHRHEVAQKNQWNGLALGAAALGIYGLASHQDGLAALGLLGAGYSAYRGSQVNTNDCEPAYNSGYDGDYRYYQENRERGFLSNRNSRNFRNQDFRKSDRRDNGWNNRNRR